MKSLKFKTAAIGVALSTFVASHASAAIIISEVAPWSSSSSLNADWFELTNTDSSAVDITGWKMDDNSNSFASSVALNGITSIAAGESVIFTESATSQAAAFKSLWFGVNAPAVLQIGYYNGSGVGLSATADAVNIFNAAGVLQAKVTFAASDAVNPLQTFDNAAGLNNTTISVLSVVGTNSAFIASNDINQIGSPGTVPVPTAAWLFGSGLLGLVGLVRKRG